MACEVSLAHAAGGVTGVVGVAGRDERFDGRRKSVGKRSFGVMNFMPI